MKLKDTQFECKAIFQTRGIKIVKGRTQWKCYCCSKKIFKSQYFLVYAEWAHICLDCASGFLNRKFVETTDLTNDISNFANEFHKKREEMQKDNALSML